MRAVCNSSREQSASVLRLDRYGLRNEDDPRGIPHPTVFLVDRDGVVRWKFIEKNYRVRATNEMILEALRERRR